MFQVDPVRCHHRRRLGSLRRVRRSLQAEFHVRILSSQQVSCAAANANFCQQLQAQLACHPSHHHRIARLPLPLELLAHPRQQHQPHLAHHHQRSPVACPFPHQELTLHSPFLRRVATSRLRQAASLLRPAGSRLQLLRRPPLAAPLLHHRHRRGRRVLHRARIRHRRGWVTSDDLTQHILTD